MKHLLLSLVLVGACKGGDKPASAPEPTLTPTPTQASAPTPAPAPVAPVGYTDVPLGPHMCQYVHIKEMSELLKAQMKYETVPPAIENPCNIIATDKSVEMLFSLYGTSDAETKIDGEPVTGVGDKATRDSFGNIYFWHGDKIYRLRVEDASATPNQEQTLAAAKAMSAHLPK